MGCCKYKYKEVNRMMLRDWEFGVAYDGPWELGMCEGVCSFDTPRFVEISSNGGQLLWRLSSIGCCRVFPTIYELTKVLFLLSTSFNEVPGEISTSPFQPPNWTCHDVLACSMMVIVGLHEYVPCTLLHPQTYSHIERRSMVVASPHVPG